VTHFSEGRESVTDEERSGRPATSRTEKNIAKVHKIMYEKNQLAVRKIITEDLDMRKVHAEMVPKEPTKEQSVREFLASKQITVLEHSPYSPDLVLNYFFLFLKIKEILHGRHTDDNGDIRNNITAALKVIPQNQFQNCFDGWTRRWHWCIGGGGGL
jgi:hypothetical protein